MKHSWLKLCIAGLVAYAQVKAPASAACDGGGLVVSNLVTDPSRQAPGDDCEVVRAALAAGGRALSAESVAAIGSTAGIDLSRLRELSPEAASLIAASDPDARSTGAVDLSGLKTLPPVVAEQLAAYTGRLVLTGVEELSPEAAAALARKVGQHGCVSLAGLRTLSPEAAGSLGRSSNILASFPRLGEISPAGARALIDGVQAAPRRLSGRLLDLSGIASLSPELAAELANNRDVSVALAGLRELSPEAARRLMRYRGTLRIRCPGGRITPELVDLMTAASFKKGDPGGKGGAGVTFHLVGLESLTPDDVANLAKANPFNPWLGGIKRLEPATVRALVAQLPRNHVYFPDLEELPSEFARASFLKKDLQIGFDAGSLTSVSLDVAKALADGEQEHHLYGLKTITPEVAETLLASSKTHVKRELFEKNWDLVKQLSPGARAKLDRTAMFEFTEFKSLEADDAKILASLGNLSLPSLTSLSGEAAAIVATAKGRLSLPALAEIPTDVAAALAAGTGVVELPGITALAAPDAVAVAAALAGKKGDLALPNLERISPKALTALRKKRDIDMPDIDMLELIPEPDGSPTEDIVIPEGFPNRLPLP